MERMLKWWIGSAALSASLAASLAQPQAGSTQMPKPYATPSAVKFPVVIKWPAGRTPTAPSGFQVDALAVGLESPRWIYILGNDDVLVAQARTVKNSKDDPEQRQAMKKAGSLGESPDVITLLRDSDRDGTYETRKVFLSGLKQPFGMAQIGDRFYVANTDSIWLYAYEPNATAVTAKGRKIASLPSGGYNNHWTRNLLFDPAGKKLYATVGSATNVDEEGQDAKDSRRAAILEMEPDGSNQRVYASGLRNPNGMDWAPGTNELWTVVNERDELGDDLPPDYLTRVQQGGFYGWPYSYFGSHEDPRHEGKRRDLVAKALVPDLALGAHTASLGLAFYRGKAFPERFQNGAFIGQRGSWNRSKFSGYRVAFVPFSGSRPAGPAEDFLTGFIASEPRREVYGRPVGVAVTRDGSLLVADDGGGVVWRVRHRKEAQ